MVILQIFEGILKSFKVLKEMTMLLIGQRVLASVTSMFPILMCETHPYGKRFGRRDS